MDGFTKRSSDNMHGGAQGSVFVADHRAGAAPGAGDGVERPKSTWAEVVKEEKKEKKADGGREQHEHHLPTSTQRHNQGERNERKGGCWDDITGIVICRPQQHTSKYRREQKHIEEWKGYKRPPSEQEYSDDVSCIHDGRSFEPTREELNNLSKACRRLWELDLNRLVPGKDYIINCGKGKKVYQKGDMASENLFSWLEDGVLRRPTYSRFFALLDNYDPYQGHKEIVTQQEKHGQDAFIEEIARSASIKYLHRYLVLKGVTCQDYKTFKKMLTCLWFDLYGRGGCSESSSAFEHTFVGEIKGRSRGENEVTGFHNWIQFYVEESKGNVDYQGYILPRRPGELPESETQLLTIQFEWHGLLKSVSSTLIGVSPEFEIALYTLCFFAGEEDNHVHLGPYEVNIKCYRLGNNKIGSTFPIAEH